jgi:uncharacterized protein YdiU (UPF0061 family)
MLQTTLYIPKFFIAASGNLIMKLSIFLLKEPLMSMLKETIRAGWHFENSYSLLPDVFFSKIDPSPVRAPQIVILNDRLANTLGLHPQYLKEHAEVLAGNQVPEGAEPLAQAYGGHQFGCFTMLGDGRALLLGEQLAPDGARFDIQLKGSGRTPYSRGGDGRAALGPMLREYIISEAMHGLGIPTTRSLAVVTTGETVYRDQMLPGAILTRVAASHIRVGTFQYAAKWCSKTDLKALADYTLRRHFPDWEGQKNQYLYLLRKVIEKQARLIAQWQLVGFVHGVMNTDNMAVSGETIDYGPCAFMDVYHPDTVFSSIDLNGRYAYDNQPDIAGWNLARFAETLVTLIDDNKENAIELAQREIERFFGIFRQHWLSGMRAKLGLMNAEEQDEQLIHQLLALMAKYKADYTNTFLALTFGTIESDGLYSNKDFMDWHLAWKYRLKRQAAVGDALEALMRRSNPAVIPRNHRVEEALKAAINNDLSVMRKLLRILSSPFGHTAEQREYTSAPRPSACGYKTFCGT